jgi:hypothetical protein
VTPRSPASVIRRLVVAIVVLAVVDRFVPAAVAHAERERYESTRPFRFESSDMFALGPLVAYLREHPTGDRPRVAFMGDSVIWGYSVQSGETLPAQFQRFEPDVRVLNLGINGLGSINTYLVAKAIMDSLDTLYVLSGRPDIERPLEEWIPVEAADVRRFKLTPPSRVEPRLQSLLGFWHLYTDSYRLQAAWFGTSTRVYAYLHKMDLVLWILGQSPVRTAEVAQTEDRGGLRSVQIDRGRSGGAPDTARRAYLRGSQPLLWDFASLAVSRKKRVVFIEMNNHSRPVGRDVRGDLNVVFAPYASFLRIYVPPSFMLDEHHLTAEGSLAVAQALRRDAPPSVTVPQP